MEIRVVIFEDNLLLRESLYQLINGTEGLTCSGAFANCDDIIFNIKTSSSNIDVPQKSAFFAGSKPRIYNHLND